MPSYAHEAYPAYAELAHRRFLGFGPPNARVALDYLFHPARGILLFSPFFLWAGPGFARWLRSKRERVDGIFVLAAAVVSFLLLTGYPNWHGGWSLGSRYLLPLVFLVAAALPFALGSALSRGLFAAAVAFAAGWHALAALSWPIWKAGMFPSPEPLLLVGVAAYLHAQANESRSWHLSLAVRALVLLALPWTHATPW